MSIYNDPRILVTGSRGFLGRHVIKALTEYRDGGTDGARKGIQIFDPDRHGMDLMDKDKVLAAIWRIQPNIIIHLAAQCGGIGINSERPGEFLYNNLTMTSNLIEACRLWGETRSGDIAKFVGIGTVCSYPKHTEIPFREENLFSGYPEETNAPYGIAKRAQLEMLKAYRAQYGFNGICLIPVNMAGEHDNFNDESSHVIPAMLKKFHKAKVENAPSVVLWGDGTPTREFLYAGDCAEAIVKATLLYNSPEPVNIGTGRECSIDKLAHMVKSVVQYQGEIVWDTTKPNGQPRRCLDVSRAKRFGFTATTDLDEILRRSYQWALENNVL